MSFITSVQTNISAVFFPLYWLEYMTYIDCSLPPPETSKMRSKLSTSSRAVRSRRTSIWGWWKRSMSTFASPSTFPFPSPSASNCSELLSSTCILQRIFLLLELVFPFHPHYLLSDRTLRSIPRVLRTKYPMKWSNCDWLFLFSAVRYRIFDEMEKGTLIGRAVIQF